MEGLVDPVVQADSQSHDTCTSGLFRHFNSCAALLQLPTCIQDNSQLTLSLGMDVIGGHTVGQPGP